MLFEVETVLWPTAAKKAGKWQRAIVKAVDGCVATWYSADAEPIQMRQAKEDAKKKGDKKKGETAVLTSPTKSENNAQIV